MALAVYILDGDEPVPIDISDPAEQWRLACFLHAGNHILAQTDLGTAWVSTVFLPTGGFSHLVDRHGRLLLFETLIQSMADASLDGRTYHYGTSRLARSGHRHLLAYLRRRLEQG